jgi:hypothetical protein
VVVGVAVFGGPSAIPCGVVAISIVVVLLIFFLTTMIKHQNKGDQNEDKQRSEKWRK